MHPGPTTAITTPQTNLARVGDAILLEVAQGVLGVAVPLVLAEARLTMETTGRLHGAIHQRRNSCAFLRLNDLTYLEVDLDDFT